LADYDGRIDARQIILASVKITCFNKSSPYERIYMRLLIAMLQFLLSKNAKSAANLRREISAVMPKRKPRAGVK